MDAGGLLCQPEAGAHLPQLRNERRHFAGIDVRRLSAGDAGMDPRAQPSSVSALGGARYHRNQHIRNEVHKKVCDHVRFQVASFQVENGKDSARDK